LQSINQSINQLLVLINILFSAVHKHVRHRS